MEEELLSIKNNAVSLILDAQDKKTLEEIKLQFLGKSGKLTAAIKEIAKIPEERRPAIGVLANEVVALVSRQIAQSVSAGELSVINFDEKKYESAPFYVSTDATDGQLYAIHYSIPSEYLSEVTDNSYVTVSVPLGFPQTGSAIPFVPIDSVFQTQDATTVFVIEKGRAKARKIVIDEVLGRFVQVHSGLKEGDRLILNRNVISGDLIEIANQ